MIVTAHQPNFLLPASVTSKIEASDAIVWLDTVQYTKGGFTNRQRTSTGWVTAPVAHGSSFAPINKVRIGRPQGEWRNHACTQLFAEWPSEVTEKVCAQIKRGYPLLVGLNAAIITTLLGEIGYQGEQHWQSHLDEGHAVMAVSEDAFQLEPISVRLARMVEAVGGTSYLSGPSGRNYLDESPFAERGIRVDYWHHDGPNPCVLAHLSTVPV